MYPLPHQIRAPVIIIEHSKIRRIVRVKKLVDSAIPGPPLSEANREPTHVEVGVREPLLHLLDCLCRHCWVCKKNITKEQFMNIYFKVPASSDNWYRANKGGSTNLTLGRTGIANPELELSKVHHVNSQK